MTSKNPQTFLTTVLEIDDSQQYSNIIPQETPKNLFTRLPNQKSYFHMKNVLSTPNSKVSTPQSQQPKYFATNLNCNSNVIFPCNSTAKNRLLDILINW